MGYKQGKHQELTSFYFGESPASERVLVIYSRSHIEKLTSLQIHHYTQYNGSKYTSGKFCCVLCLEIILSTALLKILKV